MQTITSAEKLAQMMAGKAALTKDILFKALDEDKDLSTELAGQYKAFKDQLIHDLEIAEFSDIYAETVAYGMFAARLHDTTLATFSREEALNLLPKSNPFLRSLFGFVAGPNLNESLRRTIDELAEIFQATDLQKLFENFGSFTQRNDPFIHFYETFLAEYNPKKRKARGVWYTPEPVVNFIVRAVDDVLKEEFGLADGLADTSKVTVDWDTGDMELVKRKNKQGKMVDVSRPRIEKREIHRVQILDPAAGTGTFLAEVIKQIAPRIKQVGGSVWNRYVEENLIPRLHGFELLMASYAMCHMKLDMMLSELDYKPTDKPPRLKVYLTNTLEEGEREVKDLFLGMGRALNEEARAANDVKRNTPIMCIIGNPPYSGESANKGNWIMGLMEAYKKEPGGKEKLKERNPKWINDDYVKFIRFAEHMIEKTGEGVLGFITNHGYLDNPTFRGMRWHLLNTFDKIWVIDLHGSANKKEVAPDAPADKPVFQIKPGVSIIIAMRKINEGKRCKIEDKILLRRDLFGTANEKFHVLSTEKFLNGDQKPVEIKSPRYFYQNWQYELEPSWEKGFSIDGLMIVYSNGIVTGKDRKYITLNKDSFSASFPSSTTIERQKFTQAVSYRPFESHYLWNDPKLIERNRSDVMRNYCSDEQVGLLVSKQVRDYRFAHCFVTKKQSEAIFLSGTTATNAMNLPLYLYPEESDLDQARRVNFDPTIRKEIEKAATPKGGVVPDEVAIFDYIYGVLHCPAYRDTYAEFLKIDFPRIPYPASPKTFADISAKGAILRKLHLMEDATIGEAPYPFEGEADEDEDCLVGKPTFVETSAGNGAVFINTKGKQPSGQHFANVPKIAWEFFIGGYQPAQKWLKDHKGRTLNFDDIRHYQKIIKILSETHRIMQTIQMDLTKK